MSQERHFTTRRGFVAAMGFGGLGLYVTWAAYGASPLPFSLHTQATTPMLMASMRCRWRKTPTTPLRRWPECTKVGHFHLRSSCAAMPNS